jgi:hypothetical protein
VLTDKGQASSWLQHSTARYRKKRSSAEGSNHQLGTAWSNQNGSRSFNTWVYCMEHRAQFQELTRTRGGEAPTEAAQHSPGAAAPPLTCRRCSAAGTAVQHTIQQHILQQANSRTLLFNWNQCSAGEELQCSTHLLQCNTHPPVVQHTHVNTSTRQQQKQEQLGRAIGDACLSLDAAPPMTCRRCPAAGTAFSAPQPTPLIADMLLLLICLARHKTQDTSTAEACQL